MEFKSLGNNIKKYRNKLGLTQKELGEKILKSEISIRKYESGKINIPLSTLLELCKVFNIPLTKLLDEDIHLYTENNLNYSKEITEIILYETNSYLEKQTKALEKISSQAEDIINFGESWHKAYINATTTPQGLLDCILEYLRENDLYYTAMSFHHKDIPDYPELPYFKNSEINNIVEKVCNLVINEVDKIENFNDSVRNKTLKLTMDLLKHNNIDFNKKNLEAQYDELERQESKL